MPGLIEKAFIEPFDRLAQQLALVVPALIIVLVILVVGGVVAYVARRLTYRLLVATHFDRLMIQTGMASTIDRARVFRSPSDFGARLVQGVLWLFIILLALSGTNAQMTQDLVVRFVNYVPDIITATLVLLLGSVVSKFLARSALLAAVNAQWSGARLIAGGVRLLVMSLAVATIIVLAMFTLGALVGGVRLDPQQWVALGLALVAGALPFSAMGLAFGYLVGPNSAPAVLNLVWLPMAFASGLWIPISQLPDVVQSVAVALPPYHFVQLALGIIGASEGGSWVVHAAAVLGFTLLFLVVAAWGFRRDEGRTYG